LRHHRLARRRAGRGAGDRPGRVPEHRARSRAVPAARGRLRRDRGAGPLRRASLRPVESHVERARDCAMPSPSVKPQNVRAIVLAHAPRALWLVPLTIAEVAFDGALTLSYKYLVDHALTAER